MVDTISRSDFTKRVFGLLADPDFRSRLETRREDGSTPVVVAMMDDLLSRVLQDVAAAGDCANIVVPRGSSLVILGMCVNPELSAAERLGSKWLSDSTIEEFLETVAADGGSGTYRFTDEVVSDDTSAAVLLEAA